MQRALAIDTSGRTGTVALIEGKRVAAEDEFPHGLKHAAGLVPMIDRLCKAAGWGPKDIDVIYVSAGPGSFTGLRVGITVAKTLAFATGAQVVPVPSVEVLARNAPPEAQNVIIVLDAKRGQIFTARLSRDNAGGWQVDEPARLDTLAEILSRSPRPVHLLGEGIPYHLSAVPADDSDVIITPPENWQGRAVEVARVGAAILASGGAVDPHRLTPIYIRRPEAEEKFEAQQAGK